jgi:hypothetical protein
MTKLPFRWAIGAYCFEADPEAERKTTSSVGREAGFAGLFDRDLLSPELDHLPGGAGSSEEAKALHRGLALSSSFRNSRPTMPAPPTTVML